MSENKENTRKPRRNWKKSFLDALRNSANVRAACQAANIGRTRVYNEYAKNKKFAAAWDEAIESACDILEARAWKRSETSDAVLMFLLKAHRPGKYADRVKQEISGGLDVNGAIDVRAIDYRAGLDALKPVSHE